MPTRFDQDPDKDYGVCKDCGAPMPAEADARTHMRETSQGGRGHTISITNDTRESRINWHIQDMIENAMNDVADEILGDIYDGEYTLEEALEVVRGEYALERYLKEGSE